MGSVRYDVDAHRIVRRQTSKEKLKRFGEWCALALLAGAALWACDAIWGDMFIRELQRMTPPGW